MTSPTVEPRDADLDRTQLAPATPGTPGDAKPREAEDAGFDADTPSPVVVPIYLRPLASQASSTLQGAEPTTMRRAVNVPPEASPATQDEAPAAASDALPLGRDALADIVCEALTEALHKSMHPVVLAAIQSAQSTPAEHVPAEPERSVPDEAPAAIDEKAAEVRDGGKPAVRGRVRFAEANAKAWARHLAPRRGSSSSSPRP